MGPHLASALCFLPFNPSSQPVTQQSGWHTQMVVSHWPLSSGHMCPEACALASTPWIPGPHSSPCLPGEFVAPALCRAPGIGPEGLTSSIFKHKPMKDSQAALFTGGRLASAPCGTPTKRWKTHRPGGALSEHPGQPSSAHASPSSQGPALQAASLPPIQPPGLAPSNLLPRR